MQHNATHLHDFESDELKPGHALLYGQYLIERHLIDGGFGMTYLARDSLDRKVVIKECFPSAVCQRVGGEVRPRKRALQDQYESVIRSFLREALRMAKFDHPNIVKVHQVFQENNTAYIAMDYVDGMDLLTMLDVDPGRLTDALISDLLHDTLHALNYVHELGMLHRDVSPDNLLLDANNTLTLIDFGAAREDAAKQTRALSTVMSVKDGYSPHEFYYTDGTQRASSDIYSVGATFYHLISGMAPPDCQKRVAALSSKAPDPYRPLADGQWAFDKSFLRAIDKALSIPQRERFQSAQEWLDHLDGKYVEAPEEPQAMAAPVAETDMTEAPGVAPASASTPAPAPAPAATPAPALVEEPIATIPELDPGLAAKISLLVEDTNSKVEAVDPRKVTREAEQAAAEQEVQQAPVVDIFGQPIDDVDAWLKEQDKLAKRNRKAAIGDAGDADMSASGKDAKGSSGFGLVRVFHKLTKFRSRSVEAVQN